MTVATIFAGTNDAVLSTGPQAVYANARSGVGAGASAGTATTEQSGQEKVGGNFFCYEYALDFDTSSIPANAIISSAVLSLFANSKQSGGSGAGIHQARLTTFAGSNPAAADFVAGASLAGLTLLAHTGAQSAISTAAYTDFIDDAMAANIVKGGHTRILVTTDRLAAGTAPTAAEYVNWRTADTAGTTSDPKLVITYTVPAGRSQAVVVA